MALGQKLVPSIECFLAELRHAAAIDALAKQAGLSLDAQKSLELAHAEVWAARFVGSEQLVGFAISHRLGDEAELVDLASLPQARRQGVATRLLEKVVTLAKQRQQAALWLEVRAENTAAVRLYSKLGFVVVQRRINYYRSPPDDALCMRLALAARPTSEAT